VGSHGGIEAGGGAHDGDVGCGCAEARATATVLTLTVHSTFDN